MSHQMMRQRSPAEEDLQPTADEEKQRLGQTAAGLTKQTPITPQAIHSTDSLPASQAEHLSSAGRSSYFVGPYAPAAAVTPQVEHKKVEVIEDDLLSEFSLPDSLRQSVLHLIKIMREHGIGPAQAALHSDKSIDQTHVPSILRLLAAVSRDDHRLGPLK